MSKVKLASHLNSISGSVASSDNFYFRRSLSGKIVTCQKPQRKSKKINPHRKELMKNFGHYAALVNDALADPARAAEFRELFEAQKVNKLPFLDKQYVQFRGFVLAVLMKTPAETENQNPAPQEESNQISAPQASGNQPKNTKSSKKLPVLILSLLISSMSLIFNGCSDRPETDHSNDVPLNLPNQNDPVSQNVDYVTNSQTANNIQLSEADLLFAQAQAAFEAGDAMNAVNLCGRSAALGNADAQFNMAIFYYNGDGVKKDPKISFEWLEKAAAQKHAAATRQLAVCYEQGIGTEKDLAKAVETYKKSAALGDHHAEYKVGTAYYRGIGVVPDYETAVKWYTKAADHGVPEAMNDLALCYENGLGVTQLDTKKALSLYKKAADLGNATALKNYNRLSNASTSIFTPM